ncbi:MAG: protein-export chaperone SecB [Gammaproteobacteria bacterium]|jgi:preprotein translocase subunit SecB
MSENPAGTDPQADQGPQFAIQKIYLKDASLETPNSPTVFTQEWNPEINLQLNSDATAVAEDVHEVVLSLTVTAKLGEKTAFLAEIQQAGIFTLQGFEQNDLGPMLGAYCPSVLYPFAREAVADLVAKGGFPQLLLSPINFDALYAQRSQEAQAQTAGQPAH